MARVCYFSLALALYVLVAGSSFSGYFAKWAFQDEDPRNSFVATLTKQASRPFVYRQLIPALSDAVSRQLSEIRKKEMLARWAQYRPLSSIYAHAMNADTSAHSVEYHIAYLLCFGFWLLALILLARICLDVTGDKIASFAAPLIFAEAYPVLMTRGGYYYDPVEVFFLAASLILASRGRFFLLLLLTPLAAFNKESFLFWLPCLWFVLPKSLNSIHRALWLGACVVASGATYMVNKARFSANAGGPVEFHLLENWHFYLTPSSYFRREFTYGLALPAGISLVNVWMIVAVTYLGWRELPSEWKQHSLAAFFINLPLFLVFCWLDELRNLSLLFLAFTVLIAGVLHRALKEQRLPYRARG